MDSRHNSRNMVLGGFFIALGVLLPIIFHVFVGAGNIFLPMHIPVLLSGYFLSPLFAMLVGMITPVISSFTTGMPPTFPILPIMIVELGVYGLVSSIAYHKWRKNAIIVLIISQVIGRISVGIMVWILVLLTGINLKPLLYVKTAIITGIPGLLIQIILIPMIIRLVNKSTNYVNM